MDIGGTMVKPKSQTKKYLKKRLRNIKYLEHLSSKYKELIYCNNFRGIKLNHLVNNRLKIIVANEREINANIPIGDYALITYSDRQVYNKNILDNIDEAIKKQQWLLDRAKELDSAKFRSEVWFLEKFKHTQYYREMQFTTNTIFQSKYICDLFSRKFKVIIEVDGSIHQLYNQRQRDYLKNLGLQKAGFNVIRVEAFNEESYNNCLDKLWEIRKTHKVLYVHKDFKLNHSSHTKKY